tara:strand:+ start:5751 stop:7862 length:2112 start_codon:yes stop_codon:yes gene_type:complete
MYNNIINPKTGKNININSKLGKNVIQNYLYYLYGGNPSRFDKENEEKDIYIDFLKKTLDQCSRELELSEKNAKKIKEENQELDTLLQRCVNESNTIISKRMKDSEIKIKRLESELNDKNKKIEELKPYFEKVGFNIWEKLFINTPEQTILDSPNISQYITDHNKLHEFNDWKEALNKRLNHNILRRSIYEKTSCINWYRILKKNEECIYLDSGQPVPSIHYYSLDMEITKIEFGDNVRVLAKPIKLKNNTMNITVYSNNDKYIEKPIDLDYDEFSNILKYCFNESDLFPNIDAEYEILGPNLLKMLNLGWHIASTDGYYRSGMVREDYSVWIDIIKESLNDLYTVRTNTKYYIPRFKFIHSGNQLYFELNKDRDICKEINFPNPEDTENTKEKVLGDRQIITKDQGGNSDKVHISFKKEYESYAIFNFLNFIKENKYKFIGTEDNNQIPHGRGKIILTLHPLQWIDNSDIKFKEMINWDCYTNIHLTARANIVIYSRGTNYGNQIAINTLLEYWKIDNIDEIIGNKSNNLSYNQRISKSIFIGSADTNDKDKLRDLYRSAKKKEIGKALALQKYTILPQLKKEQEYYCKRSNINESSNICLQKLYGIDINDLCKKKTLEDGTFRLTGSLTDEYYGDYPKSQLTQYIRNKKDELIGEKSYYGYIMDDTNSYNETCCSKENIDLFSKEELPIVKDITSTDIDVVS